MKTIVRIVLTMALCASVGDSALAAERYHNSTLKWVYPLASGDFALGFDVNSAECTSPGAPQKYMYVQVGQNSVTAEGAKKIYAAALLAFATSKNVSIAFDDSTPQCYINRATVSN